MKELSSVTRTSKGQAANNKGGPRLGSLRGATQTAKDWATASYTTLDNTLTSWRRTRAQQDNMVKAKASSSRNLSSTLSQRFLFLCISQSRGYVKTTMIPVDLDLNSDGELFLKLKSEYLKLVGPFRRYLSLRSLKDIRFVQVSCNAGALLPPPLLNLGLRKHIMNMSQLHLQLVQHYPSPTHRYPCALPCYQ
jgi:hypothetical protein